MEKHMKNVKREFRDSIYNFLYFKDWSPFLQAAGLTFLLLTIQIWQLRGYGRLSLMSFFAAVLCMCQASSTAIRFRKSLSPYFQENTLLLLLLESISLLFIFRNHLVIVGEIGAIREFILIFGLLTIIAAQIRQLFFTAKKWKPSKTTTIKIVLLGVICLVIGFLLNIECFNTWPRWDSYNYFHHIEAKVTAKNIFSPGESGLKVCGHISTSYALLILLFQSLPRISNLNATYLSNMFLVAVCLVTYYLIFEHLLPNRKWPLHMLYSVAAVCSPWIFGSVANINAEHLLLTGILLLIYAVSVDNTVLIILSTFVVCTVRETGALVAAAIIFVHLIHSIFMGKIKGKDVKFNWSSYLFTFFIGLTWLAQYFANNWAKGMQTLNNVDRLLDGHALNQFGFSILHIMDLLVGCLVVNFNWLLSGLVLIALSIFIIRMIKNKTRAAISSSNGYLYVTTGLLVFLAASASFITSNVYRYYTVASGLLPILGLCGVDYICGKKTVLNYIFTCVVGALLMLQSYTTIDPVTINIYPTISTGKGVVVPLPQHTEAYNDPAFTACCASNRQIMYLDKALDKVYASIYKDADVEGTKILASNEYVAKVGQLGSLYCIWGFGYKYVEPPMWGVWNSDGQRRCLSYEPDYIIDPEYVRANTDLSDYFEIYDHVYYVKMPWGDTVLESLCERYPDITFYQMINYRGWVFDIYRII